ncbi:hypothetical protein D1355_21760 [Escherichia coli]|nr:hypothetical protein [Escherichia coli]
MNAITIFPSIIKLELFSSLPSCNSHPKLPNEKLLIFNHITIRIYIFSLCQKGRIYVSSFREGKHGYEEEKLRRNK